ncbi:C69 family dipeptidase [Candidatus Aciduliprofundum boonei]|uniref:Peptidase U34, dipeptidase n=1 Tax=Aciduliprofundum boonei (strain DSM 19572 / T469) TaxID=439481 RepID=B5IA28_ACIB4|nr:C69 family dipeptidase [Candidatus Aciduliprofundum boonei]ADD08338.1 peptidase U34, dipeptidase [Aciduliprofundum boonei T469]EDY36781.1 Peptidase family C69 [Aciduliprofundum boonei T469]HII54682.1 peptidase U34 [Candidatus Aciduliprofundum boonei]
MCDILVATPKFTKNGNMLFAKNSDREPNEAQKIEYIPRKKHEENYVKMTYTNFPQVKETYAVVLSRPWWMWGAEMGTNEFGLAIGNTAVFTNQKKEKKGILGMDMIRLALERKRYAKDALNFIIEIIENYGQGGSGSYKHTFLYHNSFIIADPKDAYVLETAGKHWAAKKIENFYSISNALTLSDDWDFASDSIVTLSKRNNFNFAKYFSDKFYTHFAHGRERRAFTYKMLERGENEIDVPYMMKILRSHHTRNFEPLRSSMKSVCMHYGGNLTPSQTANSQISDLKSNTHWFTGESIPCLSIFKPFFFVSPFWLKDENPTNKYGKNFWWKGEFLHRKLQMNYSKYIEEFKKERDKIQNKILALAKIKDGKITKESFDLEIKFIEKWTKLVGEENSTPRYKRIWKKINMQAGMSI